MESTMIEIKHRDTSVVLHTVDANTLRCANLKGADLSGANLRGADLNRVLFLNTKF